MIDEEIRRYLDEARSGNPVAAVMTAMLIHLFPSNSQGIGVASQYDWLLSKALQCSDSELLVCTGEEILRHKWLARNTRLAYRFFKRADAISGYKGSYALGRFFAAGKHPKAIDYFRVARKAGHVPSGAFEIRLKLRKLGLLGVLLKPFFLVAYFAAVRHAFRDERYKERFWRYRDMLKPSAADLVRRLDPNKPLDPDRTNPFAKMDEFVRSLEFRGQDGSHVLSEAKRIFRANQPKPGEPASEA